MIENDLEEPFYTWVPVSANFVNYKEGIHFPRVNRIMKALEEFENVLDKCIMIRYGMKIKRKRPFINKTKQK